MRIMGPSDYFNSDKMLNLSGILVMLVVGALSVYVAQDSGTVLLVAALCGAVLLSFLMFTSNLIKSRVYLTGLFWAQGLCIFGLYFLVSNPIVAIFSIVWVVLAAELYGPKRASWLLLGGLCIFAVSLIYYWARPSLIEVLTSVAIYGLFQVFALSTTARAIRERQLREQTAALNRELMATRDLLSQSSAQSERVRIARDLHDILGHHMTALILNLEVANHKTEGDAQQKVEASLALAKLLLSDIRTAVGELREDDSIDLQQAIGKLVAEIPQLSIEVDFSQAPVIHKLEMAETLLRCTQEGITNVLRHSDASRCRVAIEKEGDKCVLSVADNGSGTAAIVPGNGLKGMGERVKAVGGELSWQQSASGFTLRVELATDAGE